MKSVRRAAQLGACAQEPGGGAAAADSAALAPGEPSPAVQQVSHSAL